LQELSSAQLGGSPPLVGSTATPPAVDGLSKQIVGDDEQMMKQVVVVPVSASRQPSFARFAMPIAT
jgi:hypothetical protein